jgi:hypothetical protein
VNNQANGNAASGAVGGAASVGGDASHDSNGGNGGDGGDAFIAHAGVGGGDTTSGNVALVGQVNHQAIVVVPVSVQHASARYNGLSHAGQ